MPSDTTDKDEDDRYEIFVGCFARHEGDLRRFLRSLLPTATDTEEVLQQTAIVIWRKFDQFDPESNFMKWACVIARFEALAYRRKMARDRLVFRDEILELMAEEAVEELPDRRAELEALENCLNGLGVKQRKLLIKAYTPGIKIADLAEEAGASAASFYMKLNRLRQSLMKCVEGKLASELS